MRNPFPSQAEAFRDKSAGPFNSSPGDRFGAFYIKTPGGVRLTAIVSDGSDWQDAGLSGPLWEHVSVSTPIRTPTWEEMAFVKDLFFEPHECTVQYHPPKSDYVNVHKFCLHMWRCPSADFPMPPLECV